jgi:DNA-binding SARP family transcriptional activator
MQLGIHLLGRPKIERDGQEVAPRGRKAWGLLAYLLCAGAPVARERLASLLFADADDPLGALRWNLAELRRCLDLGEALKGDLLSFELPPGSVADVKVLPVGTWAECIDLPGLGRDLLERMDYPACPGFEAWLLNERRHYQAAGEATLREATLALLGAGEAERAIDVATRLVAIEPLVEDYQALLIRAYASAGDRQGAAHQLAACMELFSRELGIEPGEAVTSAAAISEGSSTVGPAMGSGAARGQLDAGKAAVDAGALEAGLDCFRRAATEAHTVGDIELKAESLFAMGSALVHSGSAPYQEEGSAALHEVLSLCERTDQRVLAAGAHREIAWREFLAGRYARAEFWLDNGAAFAQEDLSELAAFESVLGICKNDTAFYPEAIEHYERAIALAEECGDEKRIAFSLTWLARTHLLRQNATLARPAAERAVQIVQSSRWVGFQPMAEATLGEAELYGGNGQQALEMLEHAFGIGVMLHDACYECAAERGLGLVEQQRGNVGEAIDRFDGARMRLALRPDYLYLQAQALESLCAAGVEAGDERVRSWITDLESITARTGMRELLVRVYLHKAVVGDDGAFQAAVLLASEIDNPALHAEVDSRAVVVD